MDFHVLFRVILFLGEELGDVREQDQVGKRISGAPSDQGTKVKTSRFPYNNFFDTLT